MASLCTGIEVDQLGATSTCCLGSGYLRGETPHAPARRVDCVMSPCLLLTVHAEFGQVGPFVDAGRIDDDETVDAGSAAVRLAEVPPSLGELPAF